MNYRGQVLISHQGSPTSSYHVDNHRGSVNRATETVNQRPTCSLFNEQNIDSSFKQRVVNRQ